MDFNGGNHMDQRHNDIRLTSGEIAVLWGSYMNDTLGICTLSYFLKDAKDPEVRSVLEYAISISKKHIEVIKEIFNSEKFPLPTGFTKQDVNLNAKQLFTESFMLYYLQNIGSMGLNSYSLAIPNSARKDIREYFMHCLRSSAELYDKTSSIMLKKGIFIRCPSIPYPNQTEYVRHQHFLSGWFGDQRPLTSIEISFLFLNLFHNTLGNSLMTGFSQVGQSKEIRRHMVRGAEISKHHSLVFSKFLSESNLETPMTWDIMPSASTEPPFSDKLMLYHTMALNSSGLGFYGASMGGAARRDLALAYSRLIVEVGDYSEDGVKMMIKNEWFEKPPSAVDRKKLALD
jgi:hypothetical protein